MRVYHAAIRCGSDITKRVAVQAHDEDDARCLINRLLTSNREVILDDYIRDISYARREKETFKEFVERRNDIDMLLYTAGKWPSVVEPGWERKRVPA